MARNEKKYKHPRLNRILKAQSTLEYALIFPVLLLMILGIFELAFMWHQYNSLELATQEISANLALLDDFGCGQPLEVQDLIKKKTAILAERELSFAVQTSDNVTKYTSHESFNGSALVVAKLDCTPSVNGQDAHTIQLTTAHKLHFFSASLPNFRTGGRIVIIPKNVNLVSTKQSTMGQN